MISRCKIELFIFVYQIIKSLILFKEFLGIIGLYIFLNLKSKKSKFMIETLKQIDQQINEIND